jgi:hypothetical protein
MKYLDTTLKVLVCLFLLTSIVTIADHVAYQHTGFECLDGYRIHTIDLENADFFCSTQGHAATIETFKALKYSPTSPSKDTAQKDSNVKPFVVPGVGDTDKAGVFSPPSGRARPPYSAPSEKDGDE